MLTIEPDISGYSARYTVELPGQTIELSSWARCPIRAALIVLMQAAELVKP